MQLGAMICIESHNYYTHTYTLISRYSYVAQHRFILNQSLLIALHSYCTMHQHGDVTLCILSIQQAAIAPIAPIAPIATFNSKYIHVAFFGDVSKNLLLDVPALHSCSYQINTIARIK